MRNKFYIYSFCISFLLNTAIQDDLFACYGIVAGKNATADGSVMVGHGEQNGPPPLFLNFTVVPRLKHEPGSMVKFYNGALFPETPESYSYIWSEMFGLKGSDAVLNEWGVMCVSDATRTKEDGPEELLKRGDLTDSGVILEIRCEIAKRAKSARQAVRLAAELIERFGYNGRGGTHIIADPNEAWLLTCAGGRRWVAARVPDDKVVILPNVNIIREVNLKDTMNFYGSADLVEYAVKRGWYDPKSGPFDFKKAYDQIAESPFTKKYGCDARQWRGQCLVTGKTIDLPVKEEGLPFAVTPAHKLTVMDMRAMLSDHLESSDFDLGVKRPDISNTQADSTASSFVCYAPKDITKPELYKDYRYENGTPHNLSNSIEGRICSKDFQEIGIFQLRSMMPAEIGCVYWRTTAAPCSGVLTPWYCGISRTPDEYHKNYKPEDNVKYDFHYNPPAGTYDYDGTKAYWIFQSVEFLVDKDYGKYIGKVRRIFDGFELELMKKQAATESKALELYRKDKKLAIDYLTEYSCGTALKALEKTRKLENELKAEILGY